jgi:hypothetical protein
MNPSDNNPSNNPQIPKRPRTCSGRTCSVPCHDRLPPSPPPGGVATASSPADAVPTDAVVVLQPSHRTNRPWNEVTASSGRAHHPIQATQVPTHPDHLFKLPNMFRALATWDEKSQPGSHALQTSSPLQCHPTHLLLLRQSLPSLQRMRYTLWLRIHPLLLDQPPGRTL